MSSSDETRDFHQSVNDFAKSIRAFNLFDYGEQHPTIYFVLMTAVALLGYGFLLLFPLMGLYAILFQLPGLIQQPLTEPVLLSCVIWVSIIIFSIAMSQHIISMRFAMPKGLMLRSDKAPELFALLKNKQSGWLWPDINHVIITDNYELDVRKIPVCGFPFWSKDVLVVGLPMLQCMPQRYFVILLQRKLIQFSRGKNIFSNWLYQLISQWMLYPVAFAERNLLGDKLICWFYKLYAPRFSRFAVYGAQRDALMADTITLSGVVNDSDLLKSIEAQHIGQHFLHNFYLPQLMDKVSKQGVAAERLTPFTRLPIALIKTFNEQRIRDSLKLICKQKIDRLSVEPPLSARMENIGHNKVRLPDLLSPPSAAQAMLKSNYMAICDIMDKHWAAMLKQRFQHKNNARKANVTSKVATPMKLGAA